MNKTLLLLSLLAASAPASVECVAATAPDAGLQTSAMAHGRWVKFHVDTVGIYEFTHSELKDLGFENPDKVRVYGYRATTLCDHNPLTAPLDLPEVASVHSSGKLLFYAEAEVHFSYEVPSTDDNLRWALTRERNPYAMAGYYFLSDEAPRQGAEATVTQAPAITSGSDAATPRSAHVSYMFMEEDTQLPTGGGTYFLGKNVSSAAPADYEVTLVNPASADINFQVAAGISYSLSGQNNYLTVNFPTGDATVVPGQNLQSAQKIQPYECFRPSCKAVMATLASADAAEVACRFQVVPSKSQFEFAAVDWVSVSYLRKNLLGEHSPMLDMVLENPLHGETVVMDGGSDATLVWDVTGSLHHVTEYTPGPDGSFTLANTAGAPTLHLVAFDPAQTQRKPVVSGQVANQNLHGSDCPDMVIVTNRLFLDKAEDLAEIHRRHQGIDVEVVSQDAIFNEFSSGTPHILAVRRYLKMLRDRNPDKLKGVVLYGMASTNQSTRMTDGNIYVITAQNEDSGDGSAPTTNSPDRYGNYDQTRSFATDTYFVRLGDDEADLPFNSPFFRALCMPMSILVGRVPVSSLAAADSYNRKVVQYLSNPPVAPVVNNAMFMSGFATRTQDMHMADSELQIAAAARLKGASLTTIRAAQNMFGTGSGDVKTVRNLVTGQLQRGVSLFSYFGHGTNETLGTIWNCVQAVGVSYNKSFPFGFFASCSSAKFDSQTKGLYADMTFKENGGSIALVASAREVYQNYNAEFGRVFSNRYFSMADKEPLGTAYFKSVNDVTATKSKGIICNTLSYCFIGDPMLPYYGSTATLNIDEVNRNAETASWTLLPGQTNRFEGRVLTDAGEIDSDFNGTIKVAVYDHPYVAVNRAAAVAEENRKPSTIDEMEFDQEQLTEITGTVTNGHFVAEGIIPVPLRPGTGSRVSLYAYTDNHLTRAIGGYKSITVDYGCESSEPGEYSTPEITSFELVTADEHSNETVTSGMARIRAIISAPAGLSISDKFCNAAKLTHNGSALNDAANHLQSIGNGLYSLTYDFTSPADGKHDITLSITDIQGNQAEASLSFDALNSLTFDLSAEPTADNSGYTFTLGSTMLSEAQVKSVIIEDFTGSYVTSVESDESGYAIWDFTDASGAKVPCGHYRAYARVASDVRYTSSPMIDLVVR